MRNYRKIPHEEGTERLSLLHARATLSVVTGRLPMKRELKGRACRESRWWSGVVTGKMDALLKKSTVPILGHPEVEDILPIQLPENNRKMFLSDLQTVALGALKNATKIADTVTFKKAIRPRPPRSLG